MRCPRASFVAVALSSVVLGCSASVPPRPPGLPPTPVTVTVKNPGGDAADPEWAALTRLGHEPWGGRRDRTNTLNIGLVDARHWQRVRLWGYPTRTAFRFGDDHYGVVAIWYSPTTENDDPESCLARFVAGARPLAETFGTKVVVSPVVHTTQRTGGTSRPMVVQAIDADVTGVFDDKSYAGALAARPVVAGHLSHPGIRGLGPPPELAARVRDRWVTEARRGSFGTPRLMEAPAPEGPLAFRSGGAVPRRVRGFAAPGP